jgi:hypothetical protein
VSWGGTRVDVFARAANGHLLHAWSSGGSAYSGWQDLGGSITTAPAVTSLASGTLDVVARGSGDSLVRRRWDGQAWSPFLSVGGIISAAPAATADPTAGRVTVFARGRDGTLWNIVLAPSGTARGWAAVASRETWAAPAVSSAGSPVLVTRNADLTPVVSIGGFTTALSGSVTGAMAVAQRSATSYTILGRGTDNALWQFDGRAGQYSWSRVGGTLS